MSKRTPEQRERARINQQRHRDRIKADPERYAQYRAHENAKARLRRSDEAAERDRARQRIRYAEMRANDPLRYEARLAQMRQRHQRLKREAIEAGETYYRGCAGHKPALYEEQNGICNGCAFQFPERNLTIDHIIPREADGSHHKSNLQLLCHACNSLKGKKSMDYLLSQLRADGIIE